MTIAVPSVLAVFLCVCGGLAIYVPGTQSTVNPRAIFVVLGAAFAGPISAIRIGVLAGIYGPLPGLYPAAIAMHVAGTLWMAFAYSNPI